MEEVAKKGGVRGYSEIVLQPRKVVANSAG